MADKHWADEMNQSAWNPGRFTLSAAGQAAAATAKVIAAHRVEYPVAVQRATVRYEPLPMGEPAPRRLSWWQWYLIFFAIAVIFGGRS